MANTLYHQLNTQSSNPISLLNKIRHATNPQQMFYTLAQTNPNIASVLKEVQENGGDAKGLFFRKAQQMGIDPQSIFNQLK